jgi:hypothetical protein
MRAYELLSEDIQLDEGYEVLAKLLGLASKGAPEAKAAIAAGEEILNGAKAADAASGFAKVGKGIGDAGAGVLKGSIGGAVGWTTLQINDAINSIKAAMPKVWEYVENGTIPLALVIGGLAIYGGVKTIDQLTAPTAPQQPRRTA